jgi:integrase/recombinase XerD
VAARLPKVITAAEYERLLAQASRRASTGIRNAAVLAVMWDAGLRVSEVCGLAPGDVARTGSSAQTLRVRRGKGGKDRANLGVPAATWALVERWASVRPTCRYFFCTLAGNQLQARYVQAMVARYARRARVYKLGDDNQPAPINPHMLRHSYATRLIEAGVPIHDVQRALGHASLATTQRYLHVNDARLAERLRAALDADGGDTGAEAVRRLVREELEALLDVMARAA